MGIERISAAQFATIIQQGMETRDSANDDAPGEIADLSIDPQSSVCEVIHDDARQVGLMITLADATVFEGSFELDLEGIVFNEGLTRSLGSQAVATAVFSRSSAPSSDIRVQRGFPIATVPDESTGRTITYVTTEERTMFAASASSFFNITTQRYELSVPVVAVTAGSQGRAGAKRINRPLRPLVGFDSVTNPSSAAGGLDREANQKLIDRDLIAIIGRELATSTGVQKVVVDDFPDVDDALIVSGTNPLLTRADSEAGAVDVYLIGAENLEQIESPAYPGAGQLIPISFAPLVQVLSVQDLSTGTTFVEGTDYDVVFDTTGLASSKRAQDGIRFRFTGAAPTIGNPVTVTYVYNNLIRRLQVALETDETLVFGRSLLFKEGTEVPIVVAANVKVKAGYSTTNVLSAISTAILAFIPRPDDRQDGALALGNAVEAFDINAKVGQISGVDNFTFTRLSRAAVPSGVSDIAIASNEWSTLAIADLVLTLI